MSVDVCFHVSLLFFLPSCLHQTWGSGCLRSEGVAKTMVTPPTPLTPGIEWHRVIMTDPGMKAFGAASNRPTGVAQLLGHQPFGLTGAQSLITNTIMYTMSIKYVQYVLLQYLIYNYMRSNILSYRMHVHARVESTPAQTLWLLWGSESCGHVAAPFVSAPSLNPNDTRVIRQTVSRCSTIAIFWRT